MGVLEAVNSKTFCLPLNPDQWTAAIPSTAAQMNLVRYAFACLRFRPIVGQRPLLKDPAALKLALATRVALRNALRAKPDAPAVEADRMKQLRHLMMGSLNEVGSAVNVSAAYGSNEAPELRMVVALKPGQKEERAEVMKVFRNALSDMDNLIDDTKYRVDGAPIWEFGGSQTSRITWLNKLAGVA
jgi:hypothetical protein